MAHRMKSEDGVEAIVLAGTELPLLLRESSSAEIEFLDTTVIHVGAVVDEQLPSALCNRRLTSDPH